MRSPVNSGQTHDSDATLDAWRAQGADRVDPVRFRFIEAMARRTAAQQGSARSLLDARLTGLLAAYGAAVDAAQAPDAAAPDSALPRSALAQLVDDMAQRPEAGAPTELQALRYFRSTWSRLHAHRRLTQSLAKEPENAGPLNSHHLVLRSLTLMRDLSPDYLHHFMSYVDALLWVEQLNNSAAPDGSNKKAARGKTNG